MLYKKLYDEYTTEEARRLWINYINHNEEYYLFYDEGGMFWTPHFVASKNPRYKDMGYQFMRLKKMELINILFFYLWKMEFFKSIGYNYTKNCLFIDSSI